MKYALCLLSVFLLNTTYTLADDTKGASKPTLENLLRDELAINPDTEVIVSRVHIPPHTSLPKHTHPGEEFAYVIEGSVYHWQENATDKIVKAGDVVKIPVNTLHTATTKEEGATALIFRVHPKGQPERVLAPDTHSH